MKKIRLGLWGFGKITVLFFLYSPVIFSMDLPIVSYRNFLQEEKCITVFDPQKESENGRLWDQVVPGQLIITPDNKGVIMSEPGRVRFVSFETNGVEDLINHCKISIVPLIAAAQKEDGSLLVVSGGNYHSSQEKKIVAEYALYSRGKCTFQHIDFPIQAISLNSDGNTVAIADLYSVTLIELDTNIKKKAEFRHYLDYHNWIVDTAINQKGNGLIVAGNKKDVQWMMNYGNLQNLKQWKSPDKIKKIEYPNMEELVYVTDSGQAKLVNTSDLFSKDNDELIATYTIAKSCSYNQFVIDSSDEVAVAYWTDDINKSQELRQKIKIYHKVENSIQKFTLEASHLNEYVYRTKFGTQDSGIGHLLAIALCGKRVVALGADGKLRCWSLPIQLSNKGNEKKVCEKIEEPRKDALTGGTNRRRSSSSSEKSIRSNFNIISSSERATKNNLTSSDGDADKQTKKTSPRILSILKPNVNSPKGSREGSPSPSSHSPRRNECGVSFELDIKDFK